MPHSSSVKHQPRHQMPGGAVLMKAMHLQQALDLLLLLSSYLEACC